MAAATDKKIDLSEVDAFDKNKLAHCETKEKNTLPDASVLAQEKTLKGIEEFKKEGMKSVETKEKNSLPTKADIEAEKSSKF